MYIKGFELSGFRSVFASPQRLGPFEKVNLFIGPNNSGKSNAIRFITRRLAPFLEKKPAKISPTDQPMSGASTSDTTWMMFDISSDAICTGLPQTRNNGIANSLRQILLRLPEASESKDTVWLPVSLNHKEHIVSISDEMIAAFQERQEQLEFHRIWQAIQQSEGGSFRQHWFPEVLTIFARSQLQEMEHVTIPTLRRIGSRLPEFKDEYGEPAGHDAIIDELAALAYPAWNRQRDRARFAAMERFVNDVLSRKDVRIEIPHDKTTVNVTMDGRVLPIEALGTGIHEIIMMAASAIVVSGAVVCIEEPETHLHPELQRKFMEFLFKETDNQYFITTHSAHVMDAVPAAVYSVQLLSGSTEYTRSLGVGDRRRICHELGYRPSDLLQSNCLLWVEGPTDRLYLNHWIGHKAPELVEGTHYSVMFYGGRLLSHLSAEETELDDFVALLPINRFPAIVIDSDRRKKGDRLNGTKRRVIAEFEKVQGFAWVTKGKEIENYLNDDLRDKIASEIHQNGIGAAYKNDPFSNALAYRSSKGGVVEKIDKLRFARAAVQDTLDWKILDLEKRVSELITFIRRANKAIHE